MRRDVDRDDCRRRALRRGDEGGATGIAGGALRIRRSRASLASRAPSPRPALAERSSSPFRLLGRDRGNRWAWRGPGPRYTLRASAWTSSSEDSANSSARVRSRNEIEPVRRCRRARLLIVAAREKPSDVSRGRRPAPTSTIVPTTIRTIWWRKRSASTWKLTPRASGRSVHSESVRVQR